MNPCSNCGVDVGDENPLIASAVRSLAAIGGPDVGIPVEAVEAAARAAFAYSCPDYEWESETLEAILRWREQARAALAAAIPHLRAQIADEIEALPVTFSREHWAMELQHGIVLDAARVARGGSDSDA